MTSNYVPPYHAKNVQMGCRTIASPYLQNVMVKEFGKTNFEVTRKCRLKLFSCIYFSASDVTVMNGELETMRRKFTLACFKALLLSRY